MTKSSTATATLSRVAGSFKRPLYAPLPRALLARLPTDLTAFELALLCGVMVLARKALKQYRHERSYTAAGEAIDRERMRGDTLRQNWRVTNALRAQGIKADAPVYKYQDDDSSKPIYRPGNRADSRIRHAGRRGYQRSLGQQRHDPPPDYVEFETTRHAILQMAQLSCGSNVGSVEGSLDGCVEVAATVYSQIGWLDRCPLEPQQRRKSGHRGSRRMATCQCARRLIRAIPLSEGPRSTAVRVFSRRGRSTRIS